MSDHDSQSYNLQMCDCARACPRLNSGLACGWHCVHVPLLTDHSHRIMVTRSPASYGVSSFMLWQQGMPTVMCHTSECVWLEMIHMQCLCTSTWHTRHHQEQP